MQTQTEESIATRFAIPLQANTPKATCVQPVTFGVSLPKGKLPSARTVGGGLQFDSGQEIDVQLAALSRWPDRSIKWLLVDAVLPSGISGKDSQLVLKHATRDLQRRAISADQSTDSITVDTGACHFAWQRTSFCPMPQVSASGEHGGSRSGQVILEDCAGRCHEPMVEEAVIETRGPIRTTLRLVGRFRAHRGLRVQARISAYVGTGLLRIDCTLHNSRRAQHRGGLWDLGDSGSHLFRDLSLHFLAGLNADCCVEYSVDGGCKWTRSESDNVHIYQDSSGGENWRGRTHVNRENRVPLRFRGFRVDDDAFTTTGHRACPVIRVVSQNRCITIALPEFWQNFPKAVAIKDNFARIALFPGEFGDLHELQGGEQRSHRIWLDYSHRKPASLGWVFQPAVVLPTPNWCNETGALRRLPSTSSSSLNNLTMLLSESLDPVAGITAKREQVDEYGWRNYGEIFADHELQYYDDADPLVSHYNNQFDQVDGFLLNALRSGDRQLFNLADALARHVIDIDIYHTREDRAAYNGGMFWFTDHYRHAHTSTHRTYSRHNHAGGSYGGGPSAQHCFTTGLWHYYCLTGNRDARDAVVELADWIMKMDRGDWTLLGFVVGTPTGLASQTGDANFHGPGRGPGNAINALLDGFAATGERKYLVYAEALIRRTVHPSDDIERRNLLDAEKRWSYTVFLVALSKYLEVKVELNEFDRPYGYAQRSLIHYAMWMLKHEQSYLSQPENLEYPTETWPAQDLRKSNVFQLAAQHVREPLHSQFREKADRLAELAWSDLLGFHTRACARAMAIVMSEGLHAASFSKSASKECPIVSTSDDFGTPIDFVSPKLRVKNKLKRLSGIAKWSLWIVGSWRWRSTPSQAGKHDSRKTRPSHVHQQKRHEGNT